MTHWPVGWVMASREANSVRDWLVQSGLRHHTAAFAGVTEAQLMGLMMQVSICPSQADQAKPCRLLPYGCGSLARS